MQLPRAVKRKIVLWSDFWEPEPALSFHLSESDGKELLKSHVARLDDGEDEFHIAVFSKTNEQRKWRECTLHFWHLSLDEVENCKPMRDRFFLDDIINKHGPMNCAITCTMANDDSDDDDSDDGSDSSKDSEDDSDDSLLP